MALKRYIARVPLPVDHDGERRRWPLDTALPVELVESWGSRGLAPLLQMGKVTEVDLEEVARLFPDELRKLLGQPKTAAKPKPKPAQ